MDRRMFLGSLVSLLGAPLFVEAQPGRNGSVVGVLNSGFTGQSTAIAAFRSGLLDLGLIEGQTITLEIRSAGGKPEVLPVLAAELVQRKVDFILALGPAALKAARDATGTIPIVAFDLETDPVAGGFAGSLARPGANVTGLFLDHPNLTGKWLELIREVDPKVHRVALLWDATTGPWQLAAAKAAAQGLGLDLQVLEVRGFDDFDGALEAGVRGGRRDLIQLSSPLIDRHSKQTAAFTTRNRLVAISMFRVFAESGGLMSYGPKRPQYDRRLAVYVEKMLKGAKPADLPIEQPTRFELIINLRTAKTLGLTIPPSLLARADQVIE
jgi:putative tryptophan/tyrosine transport system substrate-binding protein